MMTDDDGWKSKNGERGCSHYLLVPIDLVDYDDEEEVGTGILLPRISTLNI